MLESRPRAPLALVLLSSALSAAALNLATSVLDQPRALAAWPALGLPLAAAVVALLAVAGVLFGAAGALGRRLGLAPGPLAAALFTALALAAALAPLVEVGLRDTTNERAAALLACAAGFVSCAALAVHAFAGRTERDGRAWLAFAPLAGFGALATAWLFEYHADGAGERAAALAGGAVLLAACAWTARRFAPGRVLGALVVLVAACAALDGLRAPGSDVPPRPPRDLPPVVLLTVDTLRADRVLGDGPARVATPAIDALAADSVVFTNARSAAPWTKPSLATLLTGLSPLVHGMTTRRARLPEPIETLAEHLHAAGYRTAGIGLNAHLERAFRFDQGFDDYAFPARPDYGLALGARLLEHLAPARFPELFPSTTAIADVAVDWLHAHAAEPIFLWMHVLDPHWPYEPPAEWDAHPEHEPHRWGDPTMVTNVQAGNTKPGQAERERVQELYAGEIRYVDANLGRVIAALKELGLYERALIVFASDHGEEFWEHGRYEHGHTLYDEVLHVPLAFKLPGAGAHERIDAPVTTMALTPTVLDLLGVPHEPEQLSARSLAPWWRDPAHAVAEPLFASGTYYFGEKRGVVFDGLKLVLELDTRRFELFDLAADPGELHSLASARRDEVKHGLELLDEWQARCAALRATLGIAAESAEAGDDAQRAMQALGYTGNE